MVHQSAPDHSSGLQYFASPLQHVAVPQQEGLACIISATDFRQLLSIGKKLSGLIEARSGQQSAGLSTFLMYALCMTYILFIFSMKFQAFSKLLWTIRAFL